jgi:hypothetical protein
MDTLPLPFMGPFMSKASSPHVVPGLRQKNAPGVSVRGFSVFARVRWFSWITANAHALTRKLPITCVGLYPHI